MVKLESQNERKKLLRIEKPLRHEERWNKDFVNPDLTVRERKTHFELRQQSKQRKENGDKNLIIDQAIRILSCVVKTDILSPK